MANILFVDAATWIASDSKLNAVGLVSPWDSRSSGAFPLSCIFCWVLSLRRSTLI